MIDKIIFGCIKIKKKLCLILAMRLLFSGCSSAPAEKESESDVPENSDSAAAEETEETEKEINKTDFVQHKRSRFCCVCARHVLSLGGESPLQTRQ